MITVVLDDDPTGTQAMSDVPVILDWDDVAAWDTVGLADRAVHVLTNSRAFDPAEAAALVRSAAAAGLARFADARVVLRGDSTLRAHLWEEYEALREVTAPGREAVPLLLVPALPAAGRVTIDGVHLIERDGARVPLDRTEYAADAALAYSTSDLASWAEERSGGRLAARDATAVPLAKLRSGQGADAVARALATAAGRGRPAVVVPDAETGADLAVIAAGLELAERRGVPVIVRSAPAFVSVLTGSAAGGPVPPPDGARGVLVVCGSFVPSTTAQLAALEREWPGVTVWVRAAELAAGDGGEVVERAARDARAALAAGGLAVVATERERDPALVSPVDQRRVAAALARVARLAPAGVVVAKGGITSAVTAADGLGARSARVAGPVLTGVALWRLPDGTDYLVVPGNVGGQRLLVDLVEAIGPC